MIRGVVDDQEDFAGCKATDEVFEETPERIAIEYVRKLVGKGSLVEAGRAENVGGLALTVGINSGLNSDT